MPWLAHEANREGIVAAEHATGKNISYDVRAMSVNATEGFVKIITDPKTDEVLTVHGQAIHILNPWATGGLQPGPSACR